jgi:hypothetical protein
MFKVGFLISWDGQATLHNRPVYDETHYQQGTAVLR